MRNISKILQSVDARHTKVTLPTKYRQSFSRYLFKRKLVLDRPYTTEMWNGVESTYTFFVLPISPDVAHLIFDDWIDECSEAIRE